MRIRSLAMVGVAVWTLVGCSASPSAPDLVGLVQARAQLCKFDAAEQGWAFDQASIIPNDQIPIGNTGRHPGDEMHYLRVPIVSASFQDGDIAAVGFDMKDDPATGWQISSVPAGTTSYPPFWTSQCNGSDAEVKQALITDPLPGVEPQAAPAPAPVEQTPTPTTPAPTTATRFPIAAVNGTQMNDGGLAVEVFVITNLVVTDKGPKNSPAKSGENEMMSVSFTAKNTAGQVLQITPKVEASAGAGDAVEFHSPDGTNRCYTLRPNESKRITITGANAYEPQLIDWTSAQVVNLQGTITANDCNN